MKRIFSIFAAALIVFGAASCKKSDKKSEPADPKNTFTIELNRVGDDYVYFSVTPSDKKITWAWYVAKKEWTKKYASIQAYVEEEMADFEAWGESFTFASLKANGWIRTGDYLNKKSFDLAYETNEVLVVFQLDENLNIIGDVAYATFTTLPYGFEDLGLPSGYCWRRFNEEINDTEYLTYQEGYDASNGYVPTKEQWQELMDNCTWTWTNEGSSGSERGYIVLGPNGNSIFLPADGGIDRNGNQVSYGYNGWYWTRETYGNDCAWDFEFSTDKTNTFADPFHWVYRTGRMTVRTIALNPNKK